MMILPAEVIDLLEMTSVTCLVCTGRLEILSERTVFCPECGRFFEVAEKARENLFLKRGGEYDPWKGNPCPTKTSWT